MKKKGILILSGALVVGFFAINSYDKDIKKDIIYSDAILVDYDKNQLVNDADVIISGEVISSEVELDFEGLPATDYKIKVNSIFKGNPGEVVEVRTSGGETDDIKFIPDDKEALFEIGEEVVVFLTNEKGDREDKDNFGYYVLGQHQGKFKNYNGILKNGEYEFNYSNLQSELMNINEQNEKARLRKIDSSMGDEI